MGITIGRRNGSPRPLNTNGKNHSIEIRTFHDRDVAATPGYRHGAGPERGY